LTYILLFAAVAQAVLVVGLVPVLARSRRRGDSNYRPNVLAVLCLRGEDPFVRKTIKALLDQDYDKLEVRVVVDSEQDPVWETVVSVVQESGADSIVEITALAQPLDTCTRKSSAILQAVSTLEDHHEVVVLLDADAVTPKKWLRELVAPLEDPNVMLSSGNRWYMPTHPTLGSLVRYLFNVSAFVQMYWFSIVWGGSVAISRRFLEESDYLNQLPYAFGDDTLLARCALRERFKIAFVPTQILINRETCRLNGFYRFMQRQLLTVRLHHPNFWMVVVFGLFTTGMLAAAIAAATYYAWLGNWASFWPLLAGVAAYQIIIFLSIALMEYSVRPIIRERQEETRWLGVWGLVKLVPALFLAETVYSICLLHTLFVRSHSWRGVTYRFGNNPKVKVIDDQQNWAVDVAAVASAESI
jgi:cellulose synthase/poly-beta-1,6-N-acetylglucosamine synthase-like glycosyltransferase